MSSHSFLMTVELQPYGAALRVFARNVIMPKHIAEKYVSCTSTRSSRKVVHGQALGELRVICHQISIESRLEAYHV